MMLYLLLWACAPNDPPPTASATRGDLEIRLDVKGEFEAIEAERIANPISGWPEIAFIVEEGTRVEKGDVVVKLNMEEHEKELIEAQGHLDTSTTRIEQARARLAIKLGEARAQVVEAELDAELAQLRQTDSNTVPKVERERSRIAALQAKIVTDSADSHLRRVELEAKSEIQILELQAKIAAEEVAQLKKDISRAVLVAPAPGLVLIQELWGEKFKVGKEAPQDYTLILLPDISRLQVVAWVHEVDSPKVAVGQQAAITMDAHADTNVNATIVEVAPLAISRGDHGERYLRIVLELEKTLEKMKPGMTVQVDLAVQNIEDALLLPIEAVFIDAEGARVYNAAGEAVPVEVIASGKEQVAIDGLQEGTQVLVVDPEAWARGERPGVPE